MGDRGVVAAAHRTAQAQAGVITRAQAMQLGMTPGMVAAQVASGRWQRLWPGVYATFTGSLPERSGVWAALLHAGPGAVVCGATALWLSGAVDQAPARIQVCVPHGRKVRVPAGPTAVEVTSSRLIRADPRASARPWRMTIEDALLDETGRACSRKAVVGLVLHVLQRRTTTPGRVQDALRTWPRHRWRALLEDLLAGAEDGVQSRLEFSYRRDVERAHGLPCGVRNVAERESSTGRSRYRDVRYQGHGLVVELDGRLAHPPEGAWRDRLRDNEVSIAGEATMRYGWHEVAVTPCTVADQVGRALRSRGWSGRVCRCGPSCAAQP